MKAVVRVWGVWCGRGDVDWKASATLAGRLDVWIKTGCQVEHVGMRSLMFACCMMVACVSFKHSRACVWSHPFSSRWHGANGAVVVNEMQDCKLDQRQLREV